MRGSIFHPLLVFDLSFFFSRLFLLFPNRPLFLAPSLSLARTFSLSLSFSRPFFSLLLASSLRFSVSLHSLSPFSSVSFHMFARHLFLSLVHGLKNKWICIIRTSTTHEQKHSPKVESPNSKNIFAAKHFQTCFISCVNAIIDNFSKSQGGTGTLTNPVVCRGGVCLCCV